MANTATANRTMQAISTGFTDNPLRLPMKTRGCRAKEFSHAYTPPASML
jgi:hypothetical protein